MPSIGFALLTTQVTYSTIPLVNFIPRKFLTFNLRQIRSPERLVLLPRFWMVVRPLSASLTNFFQMLGAILALPNERLGFMCPCVLSLSFPTALVAFSGIFFMAFWIPLSTLLGALDVLRPMLQVVFVMIFSLCFWVFGRHLKTKKPLPCVRLNSCLGNPGRSQSSGSLAAK